MCFGTCDAKSGGVIVGLPAYEQAIGKGHRSVQSAPVHWRACLNTPHKQQWDSAL